MKRFFRIVLSLACFAIVLICYTNCSQFKTGTTDRSISSVTLAMPLVEGSPEDAFQTVQSDNSISSFQDVLFQFQIPHTTASPTYAASNLPSWASLNSSTGIVSGTPTDVQSYSNVSFSVTENGVTTVSGPYTLQVYGNPLKTQQWHLKNTGQSAYAGTAGTADQDIHLSSTIQSGIFGKGIKIAISDTGVYESHRGLAGNMYSAGSRNYLNDYASTGTWAGNSTPATDNGDNAHGTAVSGLAAERGWTNVGGRGVAPLASLSGFLFIQAQSQLSSNGYLTSALYDQFAGGFDIFNYSWGDSQCALNEYDSAYTAKLLAGVTNLRSGKGATYVMAAGNDFFGYLTDCYSSASSTATFLGNANFSELETTPYTIVVGAVNADGVSSSYSSPGSNIWVSSPGGEFGLTTYSGGSNTYTEPALITSDFIGCSVGIKTFTSSYTPFNQGADPNSTCEHTSTMNGTSGATPIVSGTVALMLGANPSLTWRDVKHILAVTADKVNPTATATNNPAGKNLTGYTYQQGWVTNAAGHPFHNWYGFGRVNVDNAVTMAKSYSSALGTYQTTGWKYDSGTLNASVPANSATGLTKTLSVTENWTIESVQVQVSAKNCLGNVGVELTSPSGTKSILMNINSGILDTTMTNHIMLSNAFYGENSTGTWSLKMISGAASCSPILTSWQLDISGH
jgi:subtilisin family serine protease